jgi:apolipoprotein N-acyltransferase
VFTPQLAMMWDSLKLKPDDIKVYQKEHGLPFVEVTPYFGAALPLTLNSNELVSDKRIYTFQYQNFDGQQFKTALSICWEQLFPEKIATLVADGAQFICLMNNDSWFGKSPGAKQLRAFTRLRAIENRRSIVRSSNGGISCFIDPFGKIYGEVPWFTSTISTADVLCVKKQSFYTKHAGWFLKAVIISFLLLIGYFFLFPKR